ncbi:MAG: monovalent cation/H+ antiporter subunit D family protein [Proteobacteria bacterium]|nr:monovalent cation/H+ antiporter subunit D family protein [Pseudomonadota bacterium]
MTAFLTNLPAIVVVAPLLLAVAAVLLPRACAWGVASVATAISFISAWLLLLRFTGGRESYHLGAWQPPWGIEFALDGASVLVVVVIASLSFIATIASRAVFFPEVNPADSQRLYGAWLLAIGGLLGLALSADAFNIFVFLEISSLASVTLVAMGGQADKRALVTAFNYLVIGAIGATFYVIGVGFCYAMTGTLNMADLAVRLPQATNLTPVFIGLAFMVTGLMVKAAVFPVHFWLPSAYGFAPMAVTALLAAVATKAPLYVLARVTFTVFGSFTVMTGFILQWILIPLALMAILLGTILAIYEKDIKTMLAQSSVAQIGYIVLGFGLGTSIGLQAGLVHIANHAMIKGGMFIGLAGIATAMGRRATLGNVIGMGRRMPITAAGFIVCGLSLIGVPLTAGFISKLYLVLAVIDGGYWQITALVLLASALSVAYVWRLVEAFWFRGNGNETRLAENPLVYAPLWLLAVANVWFGMNADGLVSAAGRGADSLMTITGVG